MSSQPKQSSILRSFVRDTVVCMVGMVSCAMSGCQDGPLYALKAANPYYSMREWKHDEAIGVTDHERRRQLALLADTIDDLPADKQTFWAGHLEKMIENDESPEMRRLAIRAAGRLKGQACAEHDRQGPR